MTRERLLPTELWEQMPQYEAIREKSIDELSVVAKWFYPDFDWTWYVIAWVEEDVFFGFVDGFEPELGDFSLSELMKNRGKLGCAIERDLYFEPQPLRPIYERVNGRTLANSQ